MIYDTTKIVDTAGYGCKSKEEAHELLNTATDILIHDYEFSEDEITGEIWISSGQWCYRAVGKRFFRSDTEAEVPEMSV